VRPGKVKPVLRDVILEITLQKVEAVKKVQIEVKPY